MLTETGILDGRRATTHWAHARTHHRRAGGQSKHSALLELDAKSDRIQTALEERMRRAFLRAYGQPPQPMRRNARVERPAVAAGAAAG